MFQSSLLPVERKISIGDIYFCYELTTSRNIAAVRSWILIIVKHGGAVSSYRSMVCEQRRAVRMFYFLTEGLDIFA